MDFLNKAYAQFADIFRSMTPGAWVTAGLLLGTIVVSLGFLFKFQSTTPDGYLFQAQRFSNNTTSRMAAAFSDENLVNFDIDSSGRVRVPRGSEELYMAALVKGNALPHEFGNYLDKALELSTVYTGSEKSKQLLVTAKQKELVKTFEELPGIKHATVIVDESDQRGLHREKKKTASVTLTPDGAGRTDRLDEELIRAVRHTVMGAFRIEKKEDVQVTDTNGKSYNFGKSLGESGVEEDAYFKLTARYEQELEDKVKRMLDDISGVLVQATVFLNPETLHRQQTTAYDKEPIAISVQDSSIESSTQSAAPGGRVGLAAQNANSQAQVGTQQGPQTSNEESSTSKDSVVGADVSVKEFAAMTPKDAKVSISIPRSHYAEVWKSQQPSTPGQPTPDPTAGQLTQIEQEIVTRVENQVKNFLPPLPPGVDPYKRVVVATVDDLPLQEVQAPGMPDKALGWLSANWTTLAMFSLVAFSLLVLRSTIRSAAAQAEGADVLPPTIALHTEDEHEEESEEVEKLRRPPSTNIKEQLGDLVRDDLDSAANILRNWIGSAD